MTWCFPHRWIQELCLLSTLVIYGSLYLLNLYVNLPLFSIHHQNNTKYALLYAFRYSQLSSKWLPVVHDKVVAYRRLSSVGKKKKNISNFCPKKRLWSYKKFKGWLLTRDFLKLYLHKVFAYGRWFLMRNGHERNDCIKGQLNKTRKKEMGVFVIGY